MEARVMKKLDKNKAYRRKAWLSYRTQKKLIFAWVDSENKFKYIEYEGYVKYSRIIAKTGSVGTNTLEADDLVEVATESKKEKFRFEVGKEYATRDGYKAFILKEVKIAKMTSFIGYVRSTCDIEPCQWFEDGNEFNEKSLDLIVPRGLEDKQPIWAWDDEEENFRIFTFYDEVNDMVYAVDGSRDCEEYDNMVPVANIEPWMIEAQKLLED